VRLDRREFLTTVLSTVFLRSRSARPRKLLGLTLRAGGSQLIEEVEAACGRPLDAAYETMEDRGMNRILPDGTPCIRINPSYKSNLEELIVHELGHLRLRTRGFPGYKWIFDVNVSDDRQNQQRHLPDWLNLHVIDPLEHHVFYPRLESMGYHPGSWRVQEMKNVIAKGSYGPDITSPQELGARYYQVALELGAHDTLRRMRSRYERAGWSDGLSLGERAYYQVRAIPSWTPATSFDALIRSANILLAPIKWELRSKGMITKTKGLVSEAYGQVQICGL
jgi:hypothetical protein